MTQLGVWLSKISPGISQGSSEVPQGKLLIPSSPVPEGRLGATPPSRQELKPLKAAMENGIEKKGSNRESEKREAVRDVLGRGCEYILGKMDLYKAEQYPRGVWDSCPPELHVWK